MSPLTGNKLLIQLELENKNTCQICWCVPVILYLWGLRQENCNSKGLYSEILF